MSLQVFYIFLSDNQYPHVVAYDFIRIEGLKMPVLLLTWKLNTFSHMGLKEVRLGSWGLYDSLVD